MTTTAHEDQFTPSTQTIEIVHAPYEPVAILKRNVAELELALKRQTERAEKAEGELAELQATLAKLREQKPALYMAFSECGQFIRYWTRDTANLDATMAVNDFTVLEFFARPTPAPAVPEEWRRVIDAALGLLESTTCETGVCMCGDSVIGHADFSVGHSACDSGTYHQLGVIEQLRALLQSAEVQAGDKWQLTPAPTHPADRNVGEVRHD